MNRGRKRLLNLLVISLSLVFLSQMSVVQGFIFKKTLEPEIIPDQKNLLEHTSFLSNLGSRMTGYPGSYRAAEYIAQRFRNYGLNVVFHKYRVPVPLEKQAQIEVISDEQIIRIIRAYALYPNLIQTSSTPPEGVSGRLILLGENGLEELDGKEVNGSIVLMPFNTGKDWIDLIKLGVKAVIFAEPSFTDRTESMSKILQTPVHFPRLYVTKEDALYLSKAVDENADVQVGITLRVNYEWVEAENVIGIINGTAKTNDLIIVSSHYDSWSVVPSKSPASDEATSVAALIELARYFSEHPPRWSIWFVAFSGYWQGLAGSREFLEDILLSREVQEGAIRPWIVMNLDLSTGSNRLSVVHTSHFYQLNTFVPWESWFKSRLRNYVLDIEVETREKFSDFIDVAVQPQGWWARVPTPYITDSDPMAMAGMIAFTLRTSEDVRVFWNTPVSDLGQVNIENLSTQLTLINYILLRFANEAEWGIEWDVVSPQRLVVTGMKLGRAANSGFVTLKGKVVVYNITKGWYDRVPNALVTVRSSDTNYPFSTMISIADEEGNFIIHGLAPLFIRQTSYTIEGWVLDPYNDHIECAPNLGLYGREMNVPVRAANPVVNATTAVFRCKTVVLVDIVEPQTFMKSRLLDERDMSRSFYYQPINILPYDFSTGAESLFYGRYYAGYESLAAIFIAPEERFMIKIDYGAPVRASTFLINSSSEYPEGQGFTFKDRNVICISATSQAALDIYTVTKARYSKATSFLLRSPSLENYLKAIEKHLTRYLQYRNSNIHSKAYEEGLIVWPLSTMAYQLFMSLVYESSTTISAIVAIIIPAALFIERLLSTTAGYKRLLFLLILMALMFSIFRLLFPAFNIMEIRGNPFILIMSIPLAYLLIFSTFLLLRVSSAAIKRRREEKLGVHEIERERVSFLLQSFSLSIGYMKRRRLRTFLILTTIVINSFSMTSLSSISPYLLTREIPLAGVRSPYDGFLFKRYDITSFQVIDEPLLDYLKGIFKENAEIYPRVWLYPQTLLPQGDLISDLHSKYRTSKVEALIGLSTYEAEHLFGKALKGVNLRDEDTFACLISSSLSRTLNVTVLDTISWNGIQFTVKGIFDEIMIGEPLDIDGYPMAPFDPLTVNLISQIPVPEGTHPAIVALHSLLVIPYRTAFKLGGRLVSVGVHLLNPVGDKIYTVINDLSVLNMPIFIGRDGAAYSLSRTTTYAFLGLEPIFILALLASLNILAIMLGIVKERRGEIMTHSALGLDPKSSALLFLFEMLVYSIIGITVGYLVGINLNYLFIAYHLLPTVFTFNYSSSTVLFILIILLAFSLSSVIYPAYMASRIVTPSHERKWKMPTKPKDGEWEIPLPVVLSKDEVSGLFRFLREFYESMSEDQLKTFTFRKKIEITLESETPSFTSVVALAPFDLNITQSFSLTATPIGREQQYTFSIFLKQLTGIKSRTAWLSSNYRFIDSIRKQFLLWRSFPESEKRKYYASLGD